MMYIIAYTLCESNSLLLKPWPIEIVDLPIIKDDYFPVRYVSLPKGVYIYIYTLW